MGRDLRAPDLPRLLPGQERHPLVLKQDQDDHEQIAVLHQPEKLRHEEGYGFLWVWIRQGRDYLSRFLSFLSEGLP